MPPNLWCDGQNGDLMHGFNYPRHPNPISCARTTVRAVKRDLVDQTLFGCWSNEFCPNQPYKDVTYVTGGRSCSYTRGAKNLQIGDRGGECNQWVAMWGILEILSFCLWRGGNVKAT